MLKPIRIAKENDVTLAIPVVDGDAPIDFALASDWLAVWKRNGEIIVPSAAVEFSADDKFVLVESKAGEGITAGAYDLFLSFTYLEQSRAINLNNVLVRTEYSNDTNLNEFREFLTEDNGSVYGALISPQPIPVTYNKDAEFEELKAELRRKIAALNAEIAEYQRKIESLDDVAEQDTLLDVDGKVGSAEDTKTDPTLFGRLADLKEDVGNIDIDTTTLAKQGNSANATLTETQAQATTAATAAAEARTAAQNAAAAAGEAKQAAQGITIPTDYAKQGNDPNATNTAIKQAIDARPTTTPATPTDVTAAQAAVINAMPSGYSLQGSDITKTNTQLSAEIANVVSLIGYTISEIDAV